MIINPLKVWVQNVLPVVFDDSLSYLEIVAKVNAKTNEIIDQTNENTNAIEQLAEVISELGDIDELKALLDEVKNVIENLYTTDTPLMDGTANPGVANHAARSDHVHPSDTNKAPISHASNNTTYGIGTNNLYGHLKITTDINNTGSGTAIAPSAVKAVNDAVGEKAPIEHASNNTTYGIGTNNLYGHLKVTTDINNTGSGTAIAPSAVKVISDKVDRFGKKNLFDNWFFGKGVINQRMQTSLTGYNKYFIDRWRITGYASTQAVLSDNGITLTNSSSSGAGALVQYLDEIIPAGTTLCLSCLRNNIDGTGFTARFYHAGATTYDNLSINDMTVDGNMQTGVITLTGDCERVSLRNAPNVSSIQYIAVKLELGEYQTLAHKVGNEWILNENPDTTIELIKAQKYFQVFRTEALRPTYGLDFRPTMQSELPSLDSFILEDITYYTASSELPLT